MWSAMQHHTSIDDEEDDGEKVDRTSLSGAKMLGRIKV